ncbi:MAG: alginate lyase family protein [Hyphomicrobiales bacterium]|nr:alginate lyase family protein [Hyphomicrobiales bacterium]
MIGKRRCAIRLCAAVLIAAVTGLIGSLPALAGIKSPYGGDLSAYRVTDKDAGLFEAAARMEFLHKSDDKMLRAERQRLETAISCRAAKRLPVINKVTALPAFYEDNKAWRLAAQPFFDFEEAVTTLAAAFVATGDTYYADCLIDMLHNWAGGDALLDFHYTPERRQIWYAIESSLFAAAQSYALIRPVMRGPSAGQQRHSQLAQIEAWLNKASRVHLSVDGAGDTCCNNHFYRRALHATMIGILTGDDELFQFGFSAPLFAVSEMNADGSLPREMARGSRAAHYQNYAVLYLVQIAELAERQGYRLYDVKINGHTLGDAIGFALDLYEDPARAGAYSDEPQNVWYQNDRQYFAWMEVYLSRFDDPRMEAIAARYRPIFNRSAIGAATLYFFRPALK